VKTLATKIREWFRKSKARATACAKAEAACAKAESEFKKDHPDLFFFTAIVHREDSDRYTIIVRYGTGKMIMDPPPYKIYYVKSDFSSAEETQDKIELPRFRSGS
jgi:hypothetical protein